MENIFKIAIGFVFILLGGFSFAKGNNLQTINSIVICDTTTVFIKNSCVKDTLVGKSVVRISLNNKECENPTIKEVQIIFLSIASKDDPSKKLFDYRYLVTKELSKDAAKILAFYTEELSEILKKRGVCCKDKNSDLDNDKYDFPVTFIVTPSE